MERAKQLYPANFFRICIDEKDRDLAGCAITPLDKNRIDFAEVREIMLRMDQVFDRCGYPQAFQEKRSFKKNEDKVPSFSGVPVTEISYGDMEQYKGKLATIDVCVSSRQNASWQGMVFETNGEMRGHFNGERELLRLVQQIIDA